MSRLYPALVFIPVLLFAFIGLTGCSSATYTSRYQKESDKDNSNSHQRFTDEEDSTSIDILAEDEDDIPDDPGIDIASVMTKVNSNDASADVEADKSSLKEKMLMEIIKYLDTPYKYGGSSTDGIDCSAFTQTVYHNVLSIDLTRSAKEQFGQGVEIDNKEELQFGDLVFFNTRRRVKPGHVGIYIGDNLFAHASSKNGVIVSSMDQVYYSKRFMGGRRVEEDGVF